MEGPSAAPAEESEDPADPIEVGRLFWLSLNRGPPVANTPHQHCSADREQRDREQRFLRHEAGKRDNRSGQHCREQTSSQLRGPRLLVGHLLIAGLMFSLVPAAAAAC